MRVFVILLLVQSCIIASESRAFPSGPAAGVIQLRGKVERVLAAVERGDPSEAERAAREVVGAWEALAPRARQLIERTHPGTDQRVLHLPAEAREMAEQRRAEMLAEAAAEAAKQDGRTLVIVPAAAPTAAAENPAPAAAAASKRQSAGVSAAMPAAASEMSPASSGAVVVLGSGGPVTLPTPAPAAAAKNVTPAASPAEAAAGAAAGKTTVGGTAYTAAAGAVKVETAGGQEIVGAAAAVSAQSVSGSTATFKSHLAGGAVNTASGTYVYGAHAGQTAVTRNDDGSVDVERSGVTGVDSSYGGGVLEHSGSVAGAGSGSGSYTGETSISAKNGADYSVSTSAQKGSGIDTVVTNDDTGQSKGYNTPAFGAGAASKGRYQSDFDIFGAAGLQAKGHTLQARQQASGGNIGGVDQRRVSPGESSGKRAARMSSPPRTSGNGRSGGGSRGRR